jgi:hypothetical protein
MSKDKTKSKGSEKANTKTKAAPWKKRAQVRMEKIKRMLDFLRDGGTPGISETTLGTGNELLKVSELVNTLPDDYAPLSKAKQAKTFLVGDIVSLKAEAAGAYAGIAPDSEFMSVKITAIGSPLDPRTMIVARLSKLDGIPQPVTVKMLVMKKNFVKVVA